MAHLRRQELMTTRASRTADSFLKKEQTQAADQGAGKEKSAGSYSASFPIVGVGASAGGLEAFSALLSALPPRTGMGFVLIPHLAREHVTLLPEILGRTSVHEVVQAQQRMAVRPDTIYVIPPDTSMEISGGVLKLGPRPPGLTEQHRPIDRFLRSLAHDQGHCSIGVILSGMASDGTLGLEEIKAAGGITFAQDDSAQYDSMPRSAVSAGCVDYVLSPEAIAKELGRIASHPYVVPGLDEAIIADETSLKPLISMLHSAKGVDFSQYKRATVLRRVTRRMVVHRLDGLADYVRLLEVEPKELGLLFHDILINVTSFFRDPESFETLKVKVFAKLAGDPPRRKPLRVWVVGCSTGEEVYSIAIALSEHAEATGVRMSAQIFASDINAASIDRARAGLYPKTIAQDVSPERLRRFFTEIDGHYRVVKSIRDMCIFAQHNFLSAPPFSRMDFISCRNVLIYLTAEAQRRVLPTLHYGLNPDGYLWLGGSETLGPYRNLFALEDPRHKIYKKKSLALHDSVRMRIPMTLEPSRIRNGQPRRIETTGDKDPHKEADRVLLARFSPPSVLINNELEIVQFRGETAPYVSPAPSRATLELLKMLRDGLLIPVRAAIYKAKREQKPVRSAGLLVKTAGESRTVNVEVFPVEGVTENDRPLLIVFEEAPGPQSPTAGKKSATPKAEKGAAWREAAHLKQELVATREYLQSVIEQQEAVNEELQSANEEVQSSNEELQSLNEELETSKEEIQSSNEELSTVNEELQHRNSELAQTNNDLSNLLASVEMPIVMLGPRLRIRRFTPSAEKMLNLIPTDVGRPIGDLKLRMSVPNIEDLVEIVLDKLVPQEVEIYDRDGHWYLLRVRPTALSKTR